MVERYDDHVDFGKSDTAPLAIVVRPRDSDEDLRELRRLEISERDEMIRDTQLALPSGDVEEITEVRKDRRGPNPRILRAMMATLT
jgi:hypothetical protein